MRIAVWHNLPSGGGKRALHDQVRGLVGRGHHVEVWCPPTADRDFLPLSDFCREHVIPLAAPHVSGVWQLAARPLGLLSPVLARIRAMDAHCTNVTRLVEANGFDVLFASSCQFFRTTSIGRVTRLPSLLYLQEPYRWLYESMPNNLWAAPTPLSAGAGIRGLLRRVTDSLDTAERRIQVREEIRNACEFTSIVCNSYYSRESIIRAYGLEADVCYLGVDAARLRDEGLQREGFVLGIGAYVPEKRIEFAIDALACLTPNRPRLRWIGNYEHPNYIDHLAQRAKSRGVEFEPLVRVPDLEVVGHLNRASAMIYAPRLEPFGYAPLEAMACGCPVVAVAEGGVRETVVDGLTGLLADPIPESVAIALGRVLSDPDLASRLRAEGRRAVESRWALERATERLEQRLQTVATRNSRR